MAGSVSPAAHYRAHGQVFALALELGVTPREAEAVLAQRAARARWEEAARRLAAAQQAPVRMAGAQVAADGQPWMMRD